MIDPLRHPTRPPRRRRRSRLAGALAVGAILCLAAAPPLRAQNAPPADAAPEPEPDPLAKLPPETARKLDAALSQWLKAVAGPRQKLVARRLAATVEELTGEFQLSGASVAALKEAAGKAVEESRQAWEQAMVDWIKAIYAVQMRQTADPGELIDELAESMTNLDEGAIESMLEEAPVSDKANPVNQPAWKAGLKKALTAEQLAKVTEASDAARRQADRQLADLRERMLKSVEGQLRAEHQPVVELLLNTIPLDRARTDSVTAAAAAAVAEALAARSAALTKLLESIPPAARQNMMMADLGNEFSLRGDGQEEAVPSQQKAWRDGLAKILTPDELADWNRALAAYEGEQKKKFDEQLGRLVETFSENYRQNFSRQMAPLVADILSSVGLDPPRSEKLSKTSEKAIDAAIGAWKKRAVAEIGKMPARQREMMLQQGYVSVGWGPNDQPENQDVWKETLASLLTPEEKARWEESKSGREARRKRVATLVLVSAIDDQLALSATQREKIEPLLAKAAEGQLAERLQQQWGSMNFQSLATVARQADHAAIKPHLEDWQRRIWESRIEKPGPGEMPPAQQGGPAKPNPLSPASTGPDPVGVEARISEFLYRAMRLERGRILDRLTATANDLVRAAGLSPDKSRLLRIAAKGAAEAETNAWYEQYQQWVRSQIGTANQDPQAVQTLLQGLGRVQFGRQFTAEASGVWKETTVQLLTPEETARWQREIEARQAYQKEATLGLVLLHFDNAARLNGGQIQRLEALAEASLETYGPDIDRYFGSRDQNQPWRLNSYYNVLVLEGIPEAELKKALSPKQWETWETEFRPRTTGYWTNIKRFHEERTKKPAPNAAPPKPAARK